jgi:hypothetical protein
MIFTSRDWLCCEGAEGLGRSSYWRQSIRDKLPAKVPAKPIKGERLLVTRSQMPSKPCVKPGGNSVPGTNTDKKMTSESVLEGFRSVRVIAELAEVESDFGARDGFARRRGASLSAELSLVEPTTSLLISCGRPFTS